MNGAARAATVDLPESVNKPGRTVRAGRCRFKTQNNEADRKLPAVRITHRRRSAPFKRSNFTEQTAPPPLNSRSTDSFSGGMCEKCADVEGKKRGSQNREERVLERRVLVLVGAEPSRLYKQRTRADCYRPDNEPLETVSVMRS